jgi:hypothetical protein
VLAPTVARWLERRARLSQIIRRNTSIGREIPGDVFRVKRKSRKAFVKKGKQAKPNAAASSRAKGR